MNSFLNYLQHEWAQLYYCSPVFELILILSLIFILKSKRKSKEKRLFTLYLFSLLVMFLYTDVGFAINGCFKTFFDKKTYLRSNELITQILGAIEVYTFYSIFNIDCNSKNLIIARNLSLGVILLLLATLGKKIFYANSYYEILDTGELLTGIAFFTLTVGGVLYYVTLYKNNIISTKHTVLCFLLFSYSVISFLTFPLSIFCYTYLSEYNYWRLVMTYHVFLLILIVIKMCHFILHGTDKKTQFNTFQI